MEEWLYSWGFKLSVEKTKTVLEQTKSFKVLGMWLDTRLTCNDHINQIVNKCKKVLNIMRCLSGTDW